MSYAAAFPTTKLWIGIWIALEILQTIATIVLAKRGINALSRAF